MDLIKPLVLGVVIIIEYDNISLEEDKLWWLINMIGMLNDVTAGMLPL